MAHYYVSFSVLDLLQVGDVLEQSLCRGAELLRIMVASNQHLVAGKRFNIIDPFVFLRPYKIAENIHGIVGLDPTISVVHNDTVHFVKIRKRAVIKTNDVGVTDMQVGYIEVHCFPFR